MSAIVLLLATAVVSLSARALPRWWALVSILLAVVLVIGPIGWAGLIFGLPVWTIVTSLLLLTRRAPTEAPAAAGVSA